MISDNKVCIYDGCPNSICARGYCRRHYALIRYGYPLRDLDPLWDPPCAYPPCDKTAHTKGYCSAHYRQVKKGGEPQPLMKRAKGKVCEFEGCDGPQKSRGFCRAHYWQLRFSEEPMKPVKVATYDWGKWYRTPQGYMIQMRTNRDGTRDQRFQHRHLMEEHLGRPLTKYETVHHINGVRDDNRLENLELWSNRHPFGQRVEDKADWAIEILKLYRPEVLKENV